MSQIGYQGGAAWNYPQVGRWGMTVLPVGWSLVPDFGIRQNPTEPGQIAANVSLMEDPLRAEDTLTAYIEQQKQLIAGRIPDARIGGPQPHEFPGSQETFLLLVRHPLEGGVIMLHVQTYVRVETWVGIITLTVLDAYFPGVRPFYDTFVRGLVILPTQLVNTAGGAV